MDQQKLEKKKTKRFVGQQFGSGRWEHLLNILHLAEMSIKTFLLGPLHILKHFITGQTTINTTLTIKTCKRCVLLDSHPSYFKLFFKYDIVKHINKK